MKSSFSGKLSRRCSCKKLKRPIVKAHRCASPWIMQSHKIRHRLIKDSNAPLCKAINPSTKRNIKRGWTFMEHVAFSVRCWWSIHQRDGFKSTFVSFTWKLISQSVTRTFFFRCCINLRVEYFRGMQNQPEFWQSQVKQSYESYITRQFVFYRFE